MQNCWHETPTQRPTFKELKSTLEHLMSQEIPYIEIAIDKTQQYYCAPSFESIAEPDENDDEDNLDDGGGGGAGSDDNESYQNGGIDDNHSLKVAGTLPNTTEPQ